MDRVKDYIKYTDTAQNYTTGDVNHDIFFALVSSSVCKHMGGLMFGLKISLTYILSLFIHWVYIFCTKVKQWGILPQILFVLSFIER